MKNRMVSQAHRDGIRYLGFRPSIELKNYVEMSYIRADYVCKVTYEKIIEDLDCERLNKDTYALVTSYLRRKGCLKRSKGFGRLLS